MTAQKLDEQIEAMVSEERRRRIDEVLASRTRRVVVVLEDIFYSQNAAAVIRTCDCFGVQEIHVIENEKDFTIHADVVRGSEKWIDLIRWNSPECDNTGTCVKHLKERGYAITATTLRDDAVPLTPDAIPLERPLALCLGAEETGLSDRMHNLADYFLQIPMCGFTQSLNVSVSAALCLYELCRRIKNPEHGIDWRLAKTEHTALRKQWLRNSVKQVDRIIEAFNVRDNQ